MNTVSDKKLLAIVGYSGTGKTTLLTQLIPLLTAKQLNIAVIKHSHHNVDLDIPGKDSYQLRKAGALQTMIACDDRWALMTETPNKTCDLYQLAQHFTLPDLILVEGFKQEPIQKIALYRQAINRPYQLLIDEYTIAIASDTPLTVNVPLLDLNNIHQIASFIIGTVLSSSNEDKCNHFS